MEQDKTLQEFQQLCHAHGCKCTPQRFAVYSFIHGNLTHPDVNCIWEHVRKAIPNITRESVFRILSEFANFGIIGRMDKIIDARFDGRPTNHGHLICEGCGAIVDFDLPESLKSFEVPGKFQLNHIELRVSGLCAKCAKKSPKKE